MKPRPIFTKGVSRHTCQKAARHWARSMVRNRVAHDPLIYAFRDTLANMQPAGTTAGEMLPGGGK